MKSLKLWVHKPNFSEEELIVNQDDVPDCKVGDVLEIHHPGEDFSRLLLQIKTMGNQLKAGSTISIQENVAKLFQLRSHRDVNVRKVPLEDVQLDLVELVLKDQYIGRSDMYRMKQSLTGSCVFVGKKLSHCGMRVNVRELWRKDGKMMCGCITERTRIVYRSASAAMVFLVQLSSEMWQFNSNGDLFMETAIDGFFTDLLAHWKRQQCSHQVSVVLFSRTLYTAQEYAGMLPDLQRCLTCTGKGNYYQDHYRVVVDSEIRSDWSSLLSTLRAAFTDHCKALLSQQSRYGCGINSSASQGNILEAINLAMNVYSRHYLDCNFERNGQQAIVLTPGVGVFEVEKELAFLTKLRVIDLGVGADLVCLSEQPLHQVPLFIFPVPEDQNPYKIPHWINHSFYRSHQAQDSRSTKFHPRIQMPSHFSPIGFQKSCVHNGMLINAPKQGMTSYIAVPLPTESMSGVSEASLEATPPVVLADMGSQTDYDEFDRNVFTYHPRNQARAREKRHSLSHRQRSKSTDDLSHPSPGEEDSSRTGTSHPIVGSPPMAVPERRPGNGSFPSSPMKPLPARSIGQHNSAARLSQKGQDSATSSLPKAKSFQLPPSSSHISMSGQPSSASSFKTGMPRTSAERRTNPFSSHSRTKMTANSARWAHTFPVDDCGKPLHEHHDNRKENLVIPEVGEPEVIFTAGTPEAADTDEERRLLEERIFHAGHAAVAARNASSTGSGDELVVTDSAVKDVPATDDDAAVGRTVLHRKPSSGLMSSYHSSKRLIGLDSSLAVPLKEIDFLREVGMDWKSLIEPACLPLGTDFFPENLVAEFVESQYTLYYDDERWGTQSERIGSDLAGHPDLSERQIFFQLVLQRLSQGFQLVPKMSKGEEMTLLLENGQTIPLYSEYWVVLDQHLHRLRLSSPIIEIKRYKPRHQFPAAAVTYQYSLCCTNSCCPDIHTVQFAHPTLDEYNWNYLDQYVCGDRSFCDLLESLKYWRCCFLLLPAMASKASDESSVSGAGSAGGQSKVTLDIPDGRDSAFSLAGDEDSTRPSPKACVRNFIRFIDLLNRIRRQSKGKQQVRYVIQPQTPEDVIATQATHRRSQSSSSSSSSVLVSLDINSPSQDIRKAMLGVNGIDVLDNVMDLPTHTFVALDGIDWLLTHVTGLNNRYEAVALAQHMLDDGVMVHASRDSTVGFMDGLHFYSILPVGKEMDTRSTSSGSHTPLTACTDMTPLERFHNTWFEVSLPESSLSRRASSFMQYSPSTQPTSPFVRSQEMAELQKSEAPLTTPMEGQGWLKRNRDYYETTRLSQGDSSGVASAAHAVKTMVTQSHAGQSRSDMPEWCTVRYPTNYEPNCAFHFEIQWMVATGCLISDMVQGWTRKATSCGFHMLPVPLHPFDKTAHPLQCGVFVPMPIETILSTDERDLITMTTLLQVQSLLLDRLTFLAVPHLGLPSTVDPKVKLNENLQGIPYVHLSGVGFAQPVIGDRGMDTRRRQSSFSSYLLSSSSESEIREEVAGGGVGGRWRFYKVGLLFMPNVMLTGRWKPPTVDSAKSVCDQLTASCSDKTLLRQLLDQVEITMT